jgi:hypothetical protein
MLTSQDVECLLEIPPFFQMPIVKPCFLSPLRVQVAPTVLLDKLLRKQVPKSLSFPSVR